LPQHFHFLGEACKASNSELPQFAAVRAVFGVDEESFGGEAEELLSRAVSEGQVSTAKSGSLMAFHGGLMAKSMTEEEAFTLFVILDAYLEHVRSPENAPDGGPSSLLPRFFGAYVYVQEWSLTGLLERRICFIVCANVFAGVPADVLGGMERFDLKGSADDRAQRKPGGELMCFDLLRRDQKFVPCVPAEGEALMAQLERDTDFLLARHMPTGPLGILSYEQLPESYRGAPGLMDYSLLVGVVPRGAAGGCARIDVTEQRLVLDPVRPDPGKADDGGRSEPLPAAEDEDERWQARTEDRTLLLGIIDILQFWTPRKRLARRFKKFMLMERDDDNEYNGQLLDTVRPEHYRPRFLAFLREALAEGSWAESLPRLHRCKSDVLVERQISQLPEPTRRSVRARSERARESAPLLDSGDSWMF